MNKIVQTLTLDIIDSMCESQLRSTLKNAWAEESKQAAQEQQEREEQEKREKAGKERLNRFFERKKLKEGWDMK